MKLNKQKNIKNFFSFFYLRYPRGLAYQLNLSRRDIRRCEAYWRLHQCLINETEMGCLSRQEAVSMIPPLLMDVQPHHKVLVISCKKTCSVFFLNSFFLTFFFFQSLQGTKLLAIDIKTIDV